MLHGRAQDAWAEAEAEEARERSTLEALSRRWDNVQDYIRTLDARDGL